MQGLPGCPACAGDNFQFIRYYFHSFLRPYLLAFRPKT